MDEKRAFIVVGPESSGTKFLTRLFLRAGCEGDPWHEQRLDHHDPDTDLIVFRRSYPHAGQWPDLPAIVERFKGLGFEVRLIVIVRSLQFTLASRRQHAGGDLRGRAVEAFCKIGEQWEESGTLGVWITYESLVKYPKNTVHWLFDWCGLPIPTGIKIKDGNVKYV